ncbi:LysE family transporter [Halobacillus salinus]|uniref:LysE family transporter n=1 Tax=Halobacillus salinus TaxID=192814 RepID=UPI0009A8FD08|nr:LysE family transporter [Halobacillus salinus]
MSVFLTYILLGISLSAPVGPINAAQIDKGIRFGFMNAWLLGVGAMLADMVFMLMIFFGIANWVDTPLVQTFLWSFGFFVLCYTGVESILKSSPPPASSELTRRESPNRSLLSGFLLAISNPLNILFWLGIYGSMLAQVSQQYENLQLLLYSSGIFVGILIWDASMAALSSGAKRVVRPKVLQSISVLSGLILIMFGLYFGFQAAQLLLA